MELVDQPVAMSVFSRDDVSSIAVDFDDVWSGRTRAGYGRLAMSEPKSEWKKYERQAFVI